MAASIAAK